MPRNQRHVDRAEKEKHIVDTAYRLFLSDGYDATSMAKIATATNIASNTIYWYFKDKDEVLVAVLNRELFERLQQYQALTDTDLRTRFIWLINQLQSLSRLVSTVHARVAHSSAINIWHDQFHLLSKQIFLSVLAQSDYTVEKVDALLHIWTFSIEGLLMHGVSEAMRTQIVDLLLQQLEHLSLKS